MALFSATTTGGTAASPAETFLGPNLVDKNGVRFNVTFDTESSLILAGFIVLAIIVGGLTVRALAKAMDI